MSVDPSREGLVGDAGFPARTGVNQEEGGNDFRLELYRRNVP